MNGSGESAIRCLPTLSQIIKFCAVSVGRASLAGVYWRDRSFEIADRVCEGHVNCLSVLLPIIRRLGKSSARATRYEYQMGKWSWRHVKLINLETNESSSNYSISHVYSFILGSTIKPILTSLHSIRNANNV
jgi:hypothetical protein